MLFNKLKTAILIILIFMSTLDLSKYTFIDAFDNDKIMTLIISGLNQVHNAQKPDGSWEKYKLTEQIVNEYNDNKTDEIINKYNNLTNIEYITSIGMKSTLKYINDKRIINTSGHFDSKHTVQSMIQHYIKLTNVQKKELSDNLVNKNRDSNDVLPKFLKRILQALNYIYFSQKVEGKDAPYNNKLMIKDVSGLLVLVRNTLNSIKNYGN